MRMMTLAVGTILVGCGGGSGGSCPAFATIVDGGFSRTATTLTWTMEVEEMPAELTFDREEIPDFVLEYGWTVEIDSNRDGTHDWEVAAMHFKSGSAPRTAAPLTVLQVDLWQVIGAGSTIVGSADATIAGNTFTFVVEESEDPDLANVVDASQSAYATFHQKGASLSDQCSDSYSP